MWLRGLRTQLVSMRMWIQFLASLSGLTIWHFGEPQCRLQTRLGSRVTVVLAWAGGYSSDSTPSLGTSICLRSGPRKKTKNKKKKKKKKKRVACTVLSTAETYLM